MELSIILPAYNAEATLVAAVASIQRQTYTDFELIIVDDGSTDNTGALADDLAAQDVRICVIHQSNQGGYGARLTGLRRMRGSYFGFMDADDVMCLDFYQKLMDFAKGQDLDVAQCDIDCMGWAPSRGPNELFLTKEDVYHKVVYPRLIRGNGAVVLWDKVYRRTDSLNDLIGAPIFNFDDLVLNWQLFASVARVGYLHEVLYVYTNNVKQYKSNKTRDLLWTIDFRAKYAHVYGLKGDELVFARWAVKNAMNMIRLAMGSPRTSIRQRIAYVRSIVEAPQVRDAVDRMLRDAAHDAVLVGYQKLIGHSLAISTTRYATKLAFRSVLSSLKRKVVLG